MNLLCGTNCLNSNMILRRQWNVGIINSFLMSDVVTLGVGWCNYESTPNLYTKILLRKILSSEYMHSVRDSYTKRMLNSCGIDNVMNTSCPTMWGLTESHCAKIPSTKAKNVVFTLTDYRKDFEADKNLIIALKKSYDNVYFWVQGSGDYDYFLTFGDLINDINIIPATLNAYDDLLKSDLSIEFVGTRLHAGIRALQFGRRSKIIAVDNRAEEKRKDFNLPVMSRDYNLKSLLDSFNNNIELDLTIPFETINDWKSQF
jgi:polysaccharide pyruvyl transferase WcaK-like protein